MGTDLQGGAQLDVHGGHEMLLLQEQQGLTIDLLRQELGGQLLAPCEEEEQQQEDKRGVKERGRQKGQEKELK